uniref:Uncharacterized protein n=1 Tax=Plectus sambesii TaxID=2011161 RepID=A0A914VFY6_9BILA
MSSSTLIETVSINYEDFSESFLTCSTCLCPYDQGARRPKLLACSHTVCSLCLERIAELPQAAQTGSFRCPICREVHQIPRSGISSLPPSFLVNQLIDLMQRQRRDVVPKCSAHQAEELLFCETCDTVFCPLCSDPADASSGCHNHTIVPFSIAIKRMSEILLYKANQCVKNLNRAADNVQKETTELDRNVDRILDEVNASFQDLSQLLDSRRRELIDKVRTTRDEKRRVLMEQLAIIQGEKIKVEQECNGLQYQVEVRNITRKIADLNQRTDTTLTLIEPRENAFLRYDSSTEEVLKGIQLALQHFGTLSVSRTFPPLCTATGEPGSVFLMATVRVTTVDYNGERRQNGGDPVQATMTPLDADDAPTQAPSVGVEVVDKDDGTYELNYRAPEARKYRMDIRIFGRPIKDSPVIVEVSPHHSPVWQFGSLGTGESHLCQPVKVCCGSEGQLYILDTGNNRVKVLSSDGGFVREWTGDGLTNQSAVGLALLPGPVKELLTLNWRAKTVTKWSSCGQEIQTVSFSEFVEPIDLAVDCRGRILVADNGASKVFVFDARFRPLFSFPVSDGDQSSQDKENAPSLGTAPRRSTPNQTPGAGGQVTCVAVGMNEDILVGGASCVQLFDCGGKFVRTINVIPPRQAGAQKSAAGGASCVQLFDCGGKFVRTINVIPPRQAGAQKSAALIGGLAVDRQSGTVLAAVTEKNRTFLAVSHYKGDVDFTMDSFCAKLKRPSGVCLSPDRRHCYVADLANHCIKKFRYK